LDYPHILKVDVKIIESDEWKICDAILLENHLWLVGRWLEHQELQLAKPERIIRLPETEIEAAPLENHQFVLKTPIALAALRGTEATKYEVRESPDITFPLSLVSPILH
jgi:hypothetical protein